MIILFCFSGLSAIGQKIDAFYIGHSLSDQIPDMVKSLADDHQLNQFHWVYQSIPGAPLRWQWQRKDVNDYNTIHPHYYGFYHPEFGLPSGKFNVLVLTESVPRHWSPWGIFETYQYADSFFVYAHQYNPDIKIYLYEDWHCLKSGTPTGCHYDINSNPWRQRLSDDLPMWESVVDTLNTRYNPMNKVCMIPAGQGLIKLYDAIKDGSVPGVNDISELFSDDIHLTDQGKYFVACIHYSMLYGRSPVGLTNQLKVWWGGNFNAPTPAQALRFQEIAWETVLTYPKSCIQNLSTTDNTDAIQFDFDIYPNPVYNQIKLNYKSSEKPFQIFNIMGNLIREGIGYDVNTENLESGTYWIRIENRTKKFIRY
ncbi:MAG: T9SS type A sorting domain-containing protein [Saprospiraceae bacterium]|nr:T9SS type A sorting domain-containing protein [Saprospiraceae bacterium]